MGLRVQVYQNDSSNIACETKFSALYRRSFEAHTLRKHEIPIEVPLSAIDWAVSRRKCPLH
jgi:hypothetical protein